MKCGKAPPEKPTIMWDLRWGETPYQEKKGKETWEAKPAI